MEDEHKKRGPGRPRKYATDSSVARVRAYRDRHQEQGRRFDLYLTSSTSWRLKRLAVAWGISVAEVVDRLVVEADQRYKDIMFPET